MLKSPKYLHQLLSPFSFSAATWLKPPIAPWKSHTPPILSPVYWHNNKNKLLLLGSYACVNIVLFILAALKQAGSGVWIVVAKGCGQCLNFNCAFILVRNWASSHIPTCQGRSWSGKVGERHCNSCSLGNPSFVLNYDISIALFCSEATRALHTSFF